MTCPRCRHPMREVPGTFHKQRKWLCPHCGKVRLQRQRPRGGQISD